MIKWVYKNKKLLLFIGGISVLIPLFYITYIVLTSEGYATTVSIDVDTTLGYIIFTYYIILIASGIIYIVYWILKQIKLIINLKNEKAKTELKHLQTQVNPHFFFNMLNNLYGLVGRDSTKAKQLILKLSDMMRYSIYEGQNDHVTLQEEIDFITNYIELHKMRYHKNIDVSFNKNVDGDTLKIVPLLFIILVENAFKHGVEVLRKEAFVYIKLKADREQVYFEVENNFDKTHATEKGIGLNNLKRRLELTYPKKHLFSTQIQNNTFKVRLEIQL